MDTMPREAWCEWDTTSNVDMLHYTDYDINTVTDAPSALKMVKPGFVFMNFSWQSQFQVHIFIFVEVHLICQMFIWSDFRYLRVTRELRASAISLANGWR